MDARRERNRDRIGSAIGVALCHLLLGHALITGLEPGAVARSGAALKLFDISVPPSPLDDPKPAETAPDAEGAASPPNLEARPKPLVAPPPRIPLDPPVAAAPDAGPGADPSAGASDQAGPGAGSGGLGAGTGSGQAGAGPGGGGGLAARARLIAGRIGDSDYPRAASRARIGGTVIVGFTVGADGRPSGCSVMRSSGNADLDLTTCRLVERRFRYEPARDANGRPVRDRMGWKQSWWQEPR